jgi:DNA-binding transcriptional regulator YiaG
MIDRRVTPADLKRARERLGLSQAEFARAVNVQSDRTVRKWEAGERDIPGPVVVLLALANEFRVVEHWLRRRSRGED